MAREQKHPLELLERGDRADLSGNRLTSFGFGLGAGHLHYWDGTWQHMDHPLGAADVSVCLEHPDARTFPYQLYRASWRPDRIISWYATPSPMTIVEEKTVTWDDVFVSRLQFCYQNLYGKQHAPLEFRVVVGGKLRQAEEAARLEDALLITDKERNTCQIVGASGPLGLQELRLEREEYSLVLPLRFEGYSTEIQHEERANVYLLHAFGSSRQVAESRLRKVLQDPDAALLRRAKDWREYFDRNVPPFACPDVGFEKQYYHSFFVAKANLYDFGKQGFFQNPFTSLSKFRLLPQWYWDTCFHAVYEKWLNDVPVPKGSIRNLMLYEQVDEMRGKEHPSAFHRPFRTPTDGQLPFTLSVDAFVFGRLVDPHVMPIALWDIFLKDADVGFLSEMLPALVKYDGWIAKNRDRNHENLMNIVHQGESGWDNSRRYITHRSLKYAASPLTEEGKIMQSPDFNAYFLLSRVFIAKVARMLGNEGLASEFLEKAALTRAAIQTMWDEDLGLYVDRYEADHTPNRVKTPGGMLPMIAEIPDEHQLQEIITHLENPKEFWAPFPVPSLSMDDPWFTVEDEYQSYWNGRVWPNVNWLLIEGLCRYRRFDLAKKLAIRTVEMMTASGEPECRENYHPLTGGPHPKQDHNIFNYGWGGVGADIIIRRLMGIQGYASRGELYIDPLFPEDWNRASLGGIRIGPHEVQIELQREGAGLVCSIVHRGPGPLAVLTPDARSEVMNSEAKLRLSGRHFRTHWLEWMEG